MVEAAGEDERELAAEMAAAFLNENLPEAIFGSPKAGAGQWASLVRLVNPIQGSTLDQVQLEQNEAAFRWVVLMMGGWGLSEVKQSDPGLFLIYYAFLFDGQWASQIPSPSLILSVVS